METERQEGVDIWSWKGDLYIGIQGLKGNECIAM